jgi:hypothetical protein
MVGQVPLADLGEVFAGAADVSAMLGAFVDHLLARNGIG